MADKPQNHNRVVYVVVGQNQSSINDRVEKVLGLSSHFRKMVLVCVGRGYAKDTILPVKPFPNPLGLLRLIGLDRLKNVLDKHLLFPSRHVLYVKAVQNKLNNAISRNVKKGERVCLVTCLPPHDLALIGLFIKRQFPETYWIVDWQDLWSYDENYFQRVPQLYRERLLRLEKEVLDNCDMNVTTNLSAKEVLEKRYDAPSWSVVSINHHFYREDLLESAVEVDHFSEDKKNRIVRIGFLGTLFKPPRVPGAKVLKAIDCVIDSGINIELHVYGGATEDAKKSLKHLRNNAVYLHGRTSHIESLRRISRCDFLFLVLADLPNCRAVMSIKLPHYLLLERP